MPDPFLLDADFNHAHPLGQLEEIDKVAVYNVPCDTDAAVPFRRHNPVRPNAL